MSMPQATITDVTTGHSCWPPTSICEGSPTVISESLPASRIGDACIPHRCTRDPHPVHTPAIASGSSSVIIEGMPAARIGDSLSCGDIIASGKSTIIVGD